MTTNSADRLKKTEASSAANTASGSTTKAENEAYERSIKEIRLNPIDPERWNNAESRLNS